MPQNKLLQEYWQDRIRFWKELGILTFENVEIVLHSQQGLVRTGGIAKKVLVQPGSLLLGE
jgi:hypothetical protein